MWLRLGLCWYVLVASFTICCAVDRSFFKTCEQSGFCKRNRGLQPGKSTYHVMPKTVVINDYSVIMDLVNKKNNVLFTAKIQALEDNTARIQINEKSPLRPRYEVCDVLVGEPITKNWKVQRSSDGFQAVFGNSTAVITFSPFRVDFLVNNEVAVSINNRGLLNIEHYRKKRTNFVAKKNIKLSSPQFWEDTLLSDKSENRKKRSIPIKIALPIRSKGGDQEDGTPDKNKTAAKKDGENYKEHKFDTPAVIDTAIWEETFTNHKPCGKKDVKLTVPQFWEDTLLSDKLENKNKRTIPIKITLPIRSKGDQEYRGTGGSKTVTERQGDKKHNKIKPAVDDEGMWEETFNNHYDSKPHGPSSVGLDISFPGSEHIYGIPEHADSLALRVTKGQTDPYRLYNLDTFEYEVNSSMALYGSIPYMVAHSADKTVGLFWMNAAETWVDISSNQSAGDTPQVDTHWFSESGIIDVFVMLGPSPRNVFRQYSRLTGPTMLPPLFSIAYHQCRWNYDNQTDVKNVDAGFDEHDIPMDVIWLDIEHTDKKKYFTWDSEKFPSPVDMINELAAKGRKMVSIIDPHIKRDSSYHVNNEAHEKNLFIKMADNKTVYHGWCWPGSSSWIDFTNPDSRKWWAELFALDKYQGSTLDLFTWNDMNEPSVFGGPESTMHKDAIHFGGWEHRDVHNIYGMLLPRATYEGHLMRSNYEERPFVLSRSFYAGSQRYGAVWTGDNKASWEYLKISLPMILSLSVAGIPFAGADVGGFFKNPDVDLLVRWYQAGAFYPFFRAHASVDSKRREPWLYDADKMAIIRDAIRMRYELLPLWYTVFRESSVTGMPIIRPLWVEYPNDNNTYTMDDQFLLGNSLLVKPVTEEHSTSVSVYMPGMNAIWYDVLTYEAYAGSSWANIATPLNKIPVFQRGGSIVPKKLRVRRSSSLMANDPYTLVVAPDNKGRAKGQLYSDDGHSLDYKNGQYLLRDFQFADNQLTSSNADSNGTYSTEEWLERIMIVGINKPPSSIMISSGAEGKWSLKFKYDTSKKALVIKKPGVNISKTFVITLY